MTRPGFKTKKISRFYLLRIKSQLKTISEEEKDLSKQDIKTFVKKMSRKGYKPNVNDLENFEV